VEVRLKTQRTKLRMRAGFPLQTLSRASGVSVSRLSNWENGHVQLRDEELVTIADLLKAELDAMPVLRHTSSIYHYLREQGVN
jgi:transcriptional regulator with XRE-family HTH domain